MAAMIPSEFKKIFDAELAIFLKEKIAEVEKFTGGSQVGEWVNYLEKLLLAGGKRLRPYLAYLMYETAGGQPKKAILKGVISLELFHTFALIHDDIIDNGETRHGISTAHSHISKRLTQQNFRAEIGRAQAMLLGDLAFNWSTICLANSGLPQARVQEAEKVFRQMVSEVIIGEMLDVDSLQKLSVSSQTILKKMELKTARYSFVRPMQIGTTLVADQPELLQFAEEFGTALGMAYQIQDDLFDLTSTESRGGKTVFSDLVAGQPTLFTHYIFTKGTPKERQQLTSFFGQKIPAPKQAQVQQLFLNSGAIAYGETVLKEYLSKAGAALATAPMPAKSKQAWQYLLEVVRERAA